MKENLTNSYFEGKLSSRRVLIVLDNLENICQDENNVRDFESYMDQIMVDCPNFKFLLTSRIKFEIKEMKIFPLETLTEKHAWSML